MSDSQIFVVAVGVGVVVALILMVALFKSCWRIAEPDEALIISAIRKGHAEGMGFKIITGSGILVIPGLVKVRTLSLMAHESEITVPCVSQQKIRLDLRGVVVYKVGDDDRSIANAARRGHARSTGWRRTVLSFSWLRRGSPR